MQHFQQISFAGPSSLVNANGPVSVAPQDTTHHQPQLQGQVTQQQAQVPLVATGDWTKDLVHLAKTAELKKHALTLQLHTAHILSAHASLEQKSKTIQDIREQKNKLDSERTRLLDSLREINQDRDKVDLIEASMIRECDDLRHKINHLTEGEYTLAKHDVDRLRQELGQPPLPSLQSTLDEKSSQYLHERRLNGDSSPASPTKRSGDSDGSPTKRPRGRPRGSKNRGGRTGGAAGSSVASG